ncbi:hypothetical protein ERL59_19730, partial [Chengkuizengella sp. YPA3-1-1]|nr:hypothetical protein [Chengkuizengella marina]
MNFKGELDMKKIKLSLRIILSFIFIISIILPQKIDSAEEVDGGLNLSYLDNKLSHIGVGSSHTVALESDGTVYGVCSSCTFGQIDVTRWKDIVQVEASVRNTIGLKSDGTVVTTGDDSYTSTSRWTDIVQVDITEQNAVGLKSDGTVVVAINRSSDFPVENWTDIIQIDIKSSTIYGLKSDGTVIATENSATEVVENWTDIVQISTDTALVGLKSDGTVVAYGPTLSDDALNIIDSWTDITQVSASSRLIMGLKSNGTVVAAGELLNGTPNDVQKIESWTNIVQISAGSNHAVGLRSDGTLVVSGLYLHEEAKYDQFKNINAFNLPSLSGIESANRIVSEGT